MTAALVSCVIPVFNGERYLDEALASIFTQTHRAVEIIVVDDGSTDGTAALAQRGTYPVRYVWQSNAGCAAARNRGIREATGEFIAFLDADDRWHPEKIARQLHVLEDRPAAGATVAHAMMFREPGADASAGRPVDVPIPAYLTGTLLARRDTFARVGLFDAALKHADDTSWFLRARYLGVEIALVPDVLLYRRLHATNLSRIERSGSIDEYLRLIKSTLDRRRARDGPGNLEG